MRMIWGMPWFLAACAAGVPAPGPGPAGGGGIVAECRLLEAAHAAMVARGTAAPPDILVGCPGHEALREAMPMRAQTAALRLANRASLPGAVIAAGPRGEVVYRRMLTRGVAEDVAAAQAAGPLFRAAAGGRS